MSVEEIRVRDEPVGDGQHLLISTHAWWSGSYSFLSEGREGVPRLRYMCLVEHRRDLWIPADPADDWLLDRRRTGRRIWLLGSEKQARADGIDLDNSHNAYLTDGRRRAAYGDFYPRAGSPPQPRQGRWTQPDRDFLAALPRDAGEMLRRLERDSRNRSPSAPFRYAVDLLRSGLAPAEIRAVVYRALRGLDGIEPLRRTTDVDGRTCLALPHQTARERHELLIDPNTGLYAGERTTVIDDSGSVPAGTVTSTTSALIGVVDRLGDIPEEMNAQRRDGTP
ncbi:hypothetical protein [Pseudonocardia acaciae]|uniref:hypothetical protein n=1 Tax=Pseudonocardia acaciae TaxID=551276 RepID=UPI000688772A|nr:hypothetical protein [Pseudonocardia acaciae]